MMIVQVKLEEQKKSNKMGEVCLEDKKLIKVGGGRYPYVKLDENNESLEK